MIYHNDDISGDHRDNIDYLSSGAHSVSVALVSERKHAGLVEWPCTLMVAGTASKPAFYQWQWVSMLVIKAMKPIAIGDVVVEVLINSWPSNLVQDLDDKYLAWPMLFVDSFIASIVEDPEYFWWYVSWICLQMKCHHSFDNLHLAWSICFRFRHLLCHQFCPMLTK